MRSIFCPIIGAERKHSEGSERRADRRRRRTQAGRGTAKVIMNTYGQWTGEGSVNEKTNGNKQTLKLAAMVVFLLASVIAFIAGFAVGGIVAALQTVLMYLSVRADAKEDGDVAKTGKDLFVAACVLDWFFIICLLIHVNSSDVSPVRGREPEFREEYAWPDDELLSGIPQPVSGYGYIAQLDFWSGEAGSRVMSLHYQDVTYEESIVYFANLLGVFSKTEAAESYDGYIHGFLPDGRELTLYYNSYDSGLYLEVQGVKHYGKLQWPDWGLAKLLPVPETATGYINSDSSDYFDAVLADTDRAAFTSYAVACIRAGFDNDYSLQSDSFEGANDEGVRVLLQYNGNDTVTITVKGSE